MNTVAIAIISSLILLLLVSTYFMIKFAMIILKIEEVLEDGMRTLEAREQSISDILDIPLFYDSPQVRQVHDDIKECKDAVYKIANSLSSNVSSGEKEGTSFEEKEKD